MVHAAAAAATGVTTLGDLTLDVTVSYPNPTISFIQAGDDSVNLGDFFAQLGLPQVDFMQQLLLEEFELIYTFAQSQIQLSTIVAADDDTGVTLIPPAQDGDPAILAFEQMLLSFSSAGADINAESDAYGGRSTTLGLTATSCHPEAAEVQLALLDLLIERGAIMDEQIALLRALWREPRPSFDGVHFRMGGFGCRFSDTVPSAVAEQIRLIFRHSGDMPG